MTGPFNPLDMENLALKKGKKEREKAEALAKAAAQTGDMLDLFDGATA